MSLPQDISVFIALTGIGSIPMRCLAAQTELEYHHKIEKEVAARYEAEEQLDFLIQTSPASILVHE